MDRGSAAVPLVDEGSPTVAGICDGGSTETVIGIGLVCLTAEGCVLGFIGDGREGRLCWLMKDEKSRCSMTANSPLWQDARWTREAAAAPRSDSHPSPSLAHLLLHSSPLSLSPSSLLSLPFASTVPSLSPASHLVVTSGQPVQISINNVGVSDTPIFNDGFVFVYAIDDHWTFGNSHDVVKPWTVFGAMDEELVQFSGDFVGLSSLFMRHLAPCKVMWNDMDEMTNGTVVSNNVSGFSLEITKDEVDTVMVNGVEITSQSCTKASGWWFTGSSGDCFAGDWDEEMEVTEDFPVEEDNNSMALDNGDL
ncbi:fasciclin-like arabinogalactan protein [Striga asiatica]|uniref:Fasciclin-like arabinogalactan protein n=1 Tax=Striga asiatica TaxID=4170 RepID=A0A5A7R3Y8_STRAF|nr:fasciclin-like arabinogalactan protein [Striga asiatica]